MNRNEQGVSLVEGLLIAILVLVIGFTGYYVWHANKNVDKINNAATHTLKPVAAQRAACTGKDYKGVTYTAPGNTFTICIPNGWKIYYTGDKNGSSLVTDQKGLVYNEKVKPVIGQTGGKDGGFPFFVGYNADASGTSEDMSGYTQTGTIDAQGITGTAYYHLTGSNDSVGAGLSDLDQGTKQYVYNFEQGKATLGVGYNIFPGDTDRLALIEAVVATVKLNTNSSTKDGKIAADSQSPAAGSCDPQSGNTATIRLEQGIPSPRCVQVTANQVLKLVNPGDASITATLGGHIYDIAAGKSVTLKGAVGTYLEPGVHIVHSSVYGGDSGAEVWLQ